MFRDSVGDIRHGQSQRLKSRVQKAAEAIDVSESTVRVDVPLARPSPTYRDGGSSGSRSIANEMNTDDRDSKRVKFAESRGQKRPGEDVEEVSAKAEKQHLDDDVEVRAHKTYRVEDVVGDAAAAAPEQMQTEDRSMNSSACSKTEVFEKIEESLEQCKGVEDLKDDEIAELCIL